MRQGLLQSAEGLTEAVSNNGKTVAYSHNHFSHLIDRWEIDTSDGQVLIAEYHAIVVARSTLRYCCVCDQL
jgi:hypothetical protein